MWDNQQQSLTHYHWKQCYNQPEKANHDRGTKLLPLRSSRTQALFIKLGRNQNGVCNKTKLHRNSAFNTNVQKLQISLKWSFTTWLALYNTEEKHVNFGNFIMLISIKLDGLMLLLLLLLFFI